MVFGGEKAYPGRIGRKLGLPQSHISRIEQGLTDPRLSTITDMARLLDQELVLVPPFFSNLLPEGHLRQYRQYDMDINR